MSENQNNHLKNEMPPGEIGSRDFIGLSVPAGLAPDDGSAPAAGLDNCRN